MNDPKAKLPRLYWWHAIITTDGGYKIKRRRSGKASARLVRRAMRRPTVVSVERSYGTVPNARWYE